MDPPLPEDEPPELEPVELLELLELLEWLGLDELEDVGVSVARGEGNGMNGSRVEWVGF